MTGTTLPCGCRPGEFLCPEAVRLWDEAEPAFRRGQTSGDYTEYHEAMLRYYAHFDQYIVRLPTALGAGR